MTWVQVMEALKETPDVYWGLIRVKADMEACVAAWLITLKTITSCACGSSSTQEVLALLEHSKEGSSCARSLVVKMVRALTAEQKKDMAL